MSAYIRHSDRVLFVSFALFVGAACQPGGLGPQPVSEVDGGSAIVPDASGPDAAEGFACSLGEEPRPCDYNGPAETAWVGICRPGEMECEPHGEFAVWGECRGEVLPGEEICDDGLDNDCDGDVDEDCTPPVIPAMCSLATMTHVYGPGDCEADQAAYMMDDGVGPNFICCPLPAPDILTADPPQARGTVCQANEVITGAASAYNLRCSAINTMRYQLGAPQLPCYFGSGASGGSGVAGCSGHPTSFSVLQNNYFGSDGCSSQPYGSLFVRQSGKDCEDMSSRQLQYTGAVAGDPPAGTPVVMYSDI